MTTAYNRNIFTKGTALYTDFDLSLKTNPITGDINKKQDAEAIKQSVKNILFTNRFEKPFLPDFYGGLNDLLFEPLDAITTDILKYQIITVLGNFEPRIRVIDVIVSPIENDDNSLAVTLKYNMMNVIEPQTISVILRRIR